MKFYLILEVLQYTFKDDINEALNVIWSSPILCAQNHQWLIVPYLHSNETPGPRPTSLQKHSGIHFLYLQYYSINCNTSLTNTAIIINLCTKITNMQYYNKANTLNLLYIGIYKQVPLKGKFSSGREGALASKFNYDFK